MSSKGTKKRKTWRCDVCQIAVFDTYDEALDHEQSCQGNTEADIDALASAVARGRESGAITNASVENNYQEAEEEEEEEGLGEAVFRAVTGSNKNHVGNFNGGNLLLNNNNGEGMSPTVSTPTVLALLASSRANGGVAAAATTAAAGGNQSNNGGTGNAGIALPDVSVAATAAAAGTTAVNVASRALPNNTTTQQESTAVSAKKQTEPPAQQQQAAPSKINVEKATTTPKQPSSSPPPPNNSNNKNPPPKNPPRNKWRCDYCPAIFNEYEEAVIHETHCKKNKTPITTSITNNNNHHYHHQGGTPGLTTPNNNNSNNHKSIKTPWKCDYCPALFRSYNDALIHENECKLNQEVGNNSGSGVGGSGTAGVPTTICIPTKVGLTQTTTTTTTTNNNDNIDGAVVEISTNKAGRSSLSPAPASPSNINSNQKRLNWKCDVCLVAVFESYDEALEHENQCTGVFDGEQGLVGRDLKKSKGVNDDVEVELKRGEEVDVVEKKKEEEDGEKEKVTVEKEVVQQQQQEQPKVIQEQTPERAVPQQLPQQEELPKLQRLQETAAQKETENPPQNKPVEDTVGKKRKQPTAKESLPGLEKKRMEVRMEREREAEKERAKKARQDAAQKLKRAKELEKLHARKAKEAEKEKEKAKEAEKEQAKKAMRDAAQQANVVLPANNIFLSLKDDYYRSHMFTYFRQLGALKQAQRDIEEEKRVKDEAFLFFKNSGRKLVKCHDWKRPELGYSEVDDDYARRKVSDDIRRRLDQKNLWDIDVDDETDEAETDQSSAKSPPVQAVAKSPPKKDKSPAISNDIIGNTAKSPPKQAAAPKKDKSTAISDNAIGNGVQKQQETTQPVAKEIVEEIVQRMEVQQPAVQQPAPAKPPVQEPQITERVVQQPAVPPKEAQKPIVHQLIGQQSQQQQQQILEPTTVQQVMLKSNLTVQQEAQRPQVNLQPPKTNQQITIPSQATPSNIGKPAEKHEHFGFKNLGVHDYIFGGTVCRNHPANRKYHEFASKKCALYQNARASEKAGIAASVVNEWRALNPPGRFFKQDYQTASFTEVGNDKAIAKTKKILRAKPATPTKPGSEVNATSVPGRESIESTESSGLLPLNVAASHKRSEDVTSNTNAVIASIAQLAEENLEKDTEPLQTTPTRKQKQAETKERGSKLRPFLILVLVLVILSIAAALSAPPHYRKRGFEVLFLPSLIVLTLLLSLGLTIVYTSFTLTAATITGPRSSRRQVRSLFSKVLPFLALALIFVLVPLYLQHEPAMTVLLSMSSNIGKLALLLILPFLGFSLALTVTHEAPHHHMEGGFFQEAYNFAEDTFRAPQIPSTAEEEIICLPTLRDYLAHPEGFHMAFAPAFFGFFAYFGCLSALEEGTGGLIVPPIAEKKKTIGEESTSLGLQSVSGASAGAMAATLLASGIDPSVAAEFTSKFTWGMVSDPPGIGGYVKGNRFEEAMVDFLLKEAKAKRADKSSETPIQFDEALIPCAVSGFDLLRMKGVLLSSGSMAKAARASAGFPGLFQPVAWRESNSDKKKWLPDSLLIDGGIRDGLGLAGLGALGGAKKKRVVNVVVGDFGFSGPSGIHSLPKGVNASSLVSISIAGTPMCGPWAMENGKRAVESARKAMLMALDTPMEKGDGENHYVLRLDASKFLD